MSAGTTQKVWTEAELQALPEDGFIHEVVNGELIMSPKNTWFHGRICTRLLIAIGNFVTAHRLGAVLDSSTGFWMYNRNCRAPDISFVPKERLVALGFKPNEARFFPGALGTEYAEIVFDVSRTIQSDSLLCRRSGAFGREPDKGIRGVVAT